MADRSQELRLESRGLQCRIARLLGLLLGGQQAPVDRAELPAHRHQCRNGLLQLQHRERRGALFVTTAANARHQGVDGRQRSSDQRGHALCAPIQRNEKDQVEQDDAGNHPGTDHQQPIAQRAGLGIDIVFRNQHQQLPAGFGNGRPSRQPRAVQIQRQHATALIAQRRQCGPLVDIEGFRLEGVAADKIGVGVRGQLFINPSRLRPPAAAPAGYRSC